MTYHHYQKTENNGGNNASTFTFDTSGAIIPAGTSSAEAANRRAAQQWANFLMGRASNFTQASADLTPDIRANQIEAYAQDEYRLRSNLTVNLGVRYVQYRQPIDAKGELDNFDPSHWDPTKAPLIDPTTGFILVDSSGNPTKGDPLNGIIIGGKNSQFGDKVAVAIRDRCLNIWAATAVGLVHAYDPEMIVIGGGVMKSADVIVPYLESYVHKFAWTPWGKVQVCAAKMGNNAVLMGAVPVLSQDISATE